MSKRLRQKCFQVLSVDHVGSKGIPVLRIDIGIESQRRVLEELRKLDKIIYVHFAPPCGTASAARQIQPGPPPLRSVHFPMGLPDLTFVQHQRVQKANFLYQWTCKLVLVLHEKGVAWSIENPASSLMWITDPFLHLLQCIPNLIAFSFHTCMFAAPRKKDTALWTSVKQLRQHLERKCDNNHQHLRWGKTATGFATAEECAYNDTLCAAWAEAIYDFALARGLSPPPNTIADVQVASTQASFVNKAILGCLPRGRKLLPVISEFLQPIQFDISKLPIVQSLALGKRIPDECTDFPKGSKLLRFVMPDGGVNEEDLFGMPTKALIGIPRSPEDFLQEACKLVHPTAMAMSIGNLMERNIDAYEDPQGLEFRRVQCEFAGKLVKLCAELKVEERVRAAEMDSHIREVLSGKRVVLFKRLLEDIGYPDCKIADEMAEGFPLCGWLPASGVFPTRIRAPELHEDFLRKMANSISARSIAATTSSGCCDADEKLWQATLAEVDDGFLEGPFGRGDLPKGAIVSPRFGLQQKNKLRPIDNFSASQINGSTGIQDKFAVDAVDEICAMIKSWMQKARVGLKLVGKTYDMRKAYRQIAICDKHLDLAWIVVWDPIRGQPALPEHRTLITIKKFKKIKKNNIFFDFLKSKKIKKIKKKPREKNQKIKATNQNKNQKKTKKTKETQQNTDHVLTQALP